VSALAILLGVAILFIVGHLIRLQVVTRREEIEVSQLIGATAADVRRPFLWHGALQGFFAGAVALATAAILGAWMGAEVRALTPNYATDFKVIFLPPEASFIIVAGTALLGLFGAWIAVDLQLRRFDRV
jgi:cell division transport system permease protein